VLLLFQKLDVDDDDDDEDDNDNDGVRIGRFCRTLPVTLKHDIKARLGRYPAQHEYQTSDRNTASCSVPFM